MGIIPKQPHLEQQPEPQQLELQQPEPQHPELQQPESSQHPDDPEVQLWGRWTQRLRGLTPKVRGARQQ